MTDNATPAEVRLTDGLGPLPKAVHYWREDVPVRAGPLMHPLYSAQQMLEYGAQERAAERERCAKIADEHARRNYPWGSENTDRYHAQADWAERIAAVIRRA